MHYFEESNSKRYQSKVNNKVFNRFGVIIVIALIALEQVAPLIKEKLELCSDKIDQLLF